MAEFLKTAATSSHAKFCLSSRPWLVFEDAFQDLPGLRLQDLTFNDIRSFVADKLEGHQRMCKLSKEQPGHASELVQEIVSKADGVFLWVTLVVRDLLSGLRNRDGISDLRRRLRALPSELGVLYEHMLGHVEPFYQDQASRTFQIYGVMVAHQTNVGALELEIATTATTQITIDTPYNPMDNNEIRDRCERLDAHLKTRCAGLLEIREWDGEDSYLDTVQNGYFLKVNYLHRTVKDFLESDDVRATMLRQTTNDSGFEPNSSTLMSIIIRLKQLLYWPQFWKRLSLFLPPLSKSEKITLSDSDDKIIWDNVQMALRYAKTAEDTATTTNNTALLDELDRVGTYWAPRSPTRGLHSHWSDFEQPFEQQGGFLAEAASSGLVSYISEKLKTDSNILLDAKQSQSLLNRVLQQPSGPYRWVCMEMLDLLLTSGVNPNQLWAGHTAWQHTLSLLHSTDWGGPDGPLDASDESRGLRHLRKWVEVFAMLLRYGANPHTTCTKNHLISQAHGTHGNRRKINSHKVADVISDVFQYHLPQEAAELKRMIEDLEQKQGRSALLYNGPGALEGQGPGKKRGIALQGTGSRKRWKGGWNDEIERQVGW